MKKIPTSVAGVLCIALMMTPVWAKPVASNSTAIRFKAHGIDRAASLARASCTDVVTGMKLETVSFDNRSISSDDKKLIYSEPHWDASRTADPNFPVSLPITYKAGAAPGAGATFSVTPVDAKKPVMMRGTGGGLTFPATSCTPDKGMVSYPSTASTTKLAATIDKASWSIAWEYSTNNGRTYKAAGTSTNTAYVTLIDDGLFETVLDIACRNAKGKSAEVEVFKEIWGDFDSNAVKNVKAEPLLYWGPNADPDRNTGFSIADLLKNKDGRCGSWQRLMIATLGLQNVMVKKVSIDPRQSTNYTPLAYVLIGTDLTGIETKALPGQNNPSPRVNFDDHAIIRYDKVSKGAIYDPSYGAAYTGVINPNVDNGATTGNVDNTGKDPRNVWEKAALLGVIGARPDKTQYLVKKSNHPNELLCTYSGY